MSAVQYIILACWVVFCLYWLLSARSVKSTRETKGWLAGNWHGVWLLIGGLFLSSPPFLTRFGAPLSSLTIPLIPRSVVLHVVVVVCTVAGLVVAIVARRTLAGNWSRAVAFKEDHELITGGLYAYVRHPIYTGILLMILGTVLLVGTLSAGIGFLIIFVALWFKLRAEEELLTDHFPREYPAYKQRTKALIPSVF